MATRQQIERGLEEIGACWAVRSDKYISPQDSYDAKPTYHVHPDAKYPHERAIKRFGSLDSLMNWIDACKRAAASDDEFATVVYCGNGEWDVA
jgi:hypothetical protein